jgi:hypothetical protein
VPGLLCGPPEKAAEHRSIVPVATWVAGLVAVAAGIGLVAARAVWTSPVWLVPYALFWLWVLVVSIRFLAGRSPSSP